MVCSASCEFMHSKDISTSLMKFTELDVMKYVGGSKVIGEYRAQRTQEFWIVEERIKRLVRSMVKLLNECHNEGRCLTRFKDTNWEVTASGLACFRGVACLEKTDVLVAQNYADLHNVVLDTVFRDYCIEQHIPADWRRLLYLMSHFPHGNGYLISNYAALMPIQNRFLFSMKAHEHVKVFLDRTNRNVRRRILNQLPYAKTWSDLLEGNYLLEQSFRHQKYDTSGNPESFLDFYRNSNVHRMDRCFLTPVGGYTAEQFEMILLVRYPLYLPLLQEALCGEKELQRLEPQTTFCLDANVSRQLFIGTTKEPKEEAELYFMVGQVRIPVDSWSDRHPVTGLTAPRGLETALRFAGIEGAGLTANRPLTRQGRRA